LVKQNCRIFKLTITAHSFYTLSNLHSHNYPQVLASALVLALVLALAQQQVPPVISPNVQKNSEWQHTCFSGSRSAPNFATLGGSSSSDGQKSGPEQSPRSRAKMQVEQSRQRLLQQVSFQQQVS
jgi:hypothetical protein